MGLTGLSGLGGLSAAMGGGFSPAQLTGLQLWLDANRADSYQDSARTTLAVADADPVGSPSDASGVGNHPIQATAGSRPLLKLGIINGKAIYRFDGVNDWWSVNAMAVASGNYTMLTAFIPHAVPTGNPQYFFDTVTGRLIFAPNSGSGTSTNVAYYDGAWRDTGAVAAGAQILTWNLGATGIVSRNGASIGSSTYAAKAIGGATKAIGAVNDGTAQYLKGDLAELLLYSRSLSGAEQKQVEAYLGAKWGIAVV